MRFSLRRWVSARTEMDPRRHGGRQQRSRLKVECLEDRTLLTGTALAGLAPPAQYITNLYRDLLAREPQAAEISRWTQQIQSGQTPERLAQTFLASPEREDLLVQWQSSTLLGHPISPAELEAWRAKLAAGASSESLSASLLASTEYGMGLNDPAWLASVYRDVLGREPDGPGLAAWSSLLAGGASRQGVAEAIYASPENRALIVTAAYETLLHRAPDAVGFAAWETGLANGLDREQLLAGFVSSAEYLAQPVHAGAADFGHQTLLVQMRQGMETQFARWQQFVTNSNAAWQSGPLPGLFEVHANGNALLRLRNAFEFAGPVRYAEPSQIFDVAVTPNDPKFQDNTLYGLNGANGINAPTAWNVLTGSINPTSSGFGNAVVADLDTGIAYNHPDLYLNVWINQQEIPPSRLANLTDVDGDGLLTFWDLNNPANQGQGKITDLNGDGRIDGSDILTPMQVDSGGKDTGLGGWADGISEDGDSQHVDDLIGWNFVTNTNDPFDDNSHGTHTAGTIGAIGNNATGVVGVNWQTQIMACKFLDSTGNGSDADAAAALAYATAHGAKVSNNSWGGGSFDQTLEDAINAAGAQGHIFVAAAGNAGTNNDTTLFYPASFNLPNMIVVAATDSTGAKASFSDYGPASVGLGAPGVSIYSTIPTGATPYAFKSGTSMATPHVTGVVALLQAEHPSWSMQQFIDQVLDTTTPDSSLQGKTITGGLLNAAGAVNDTTGPRVIAHTPNGSVSAPAGLSSLQVTFSEEVDPASFTLSDITSFTGPGGSISATSVTPTAGSNNHIFTITFAAQTAVGSYSLTLGPNLTDNAGNRMSSSATIGFTLLAASALDARFDFGTARSPVATNYLQVTPDTTYSAALGYGWQTGSVSATDTHVGTDLRRDFILTPQATFAVDLPNQSYTVTMVFGDANAHHDQMGVFLQGTRVDTVGIAKNAFATKIYDGIVVSNGQLVIQLQDFGGTDPNVVLDSLEIKPDVLGPRVVSSSPKGTVHGSFSVVTFGFNEPIKDGTFTLADVDSFTGPSGSITPTAVRKVSATKWQVTFPVQSALGTYQLTIGPSITDLMGNPMNQNNNGTNGEVPADEYTATFTIS